jgi:aminoglycoside phosphotransferase (APT) family kinase protein
MSEGRHGRLRARRILQKVLGAEAEVGPARKVGEGTWRNAFAISARHRGKTTRYAVLCPREGARRELDGRLIRETALLNFLQEKAALPFRTPRVLAVVEDEGRMAQVREFIDGVELETRGALPTGTTPWDVVARCAAALHAVDICGMPVLDGPSFSTRRDHARDALQFLEKKPQWARAHAWARSYPPPDGPVRLIHGGLLSRNILIGTDGQPTIIDWEKAMLGDPAYELASATQCETAPYGKTDGMRRLLQAYALNGGEPIREEDVRFYELYHGACWWSDHHCSDQGMPLRSVQRAVGIE